MLSKQATLDRYFLDVRCQLVEIAATLDRIDRAEGDASSEQLAKLTKAIRLLGSVESDDRSERLLLHFSDLDDLELPPEQQRLLAVAP